MTYDLDVTCENCGHEGTKTAVFNTYGESPHPIKRHYCRVCSTTFLSAATNYPGAPGRDPGLWKSIAWIGNEILAQLAQTRVAVDLQDPQDGGESELERRRR